MPGKLRVPEMPCRVPEEAEALPEDRIYAVSYAYIVQRFFGMADQWICPAE